MLSYIYRLIRDFELQHGIHPNLLYLNEVHANHLTQVLNENITPQSLRDLLQMELIINREISHPHVAWTQIARKIAV